MFWFCWVMIKIEEVCQHLQIAQCAEKINAIDNFAVLTGLTKEVEQH